MRLELIPYDLKPEFVDGIKALVPVNMVTYNHLRSSVRAAVRVVGVAVYRDWNNGRTCEIHPPKNALDLLAAEIE